MKLKTRLSISFCIIIFVPILLAGFVIFGFQKFQMRTIEQTYGIETGDYHYLLNSFQLLNQYTKKEYNFLLNQVSEDPELFLDQEFLDRENRKLMDKYSYLIVRKEDRFVYLGKEDADLRVAGLPWYEEDGPDAETGTYVDGDGQVLVKQIDFLFSDGEKGTVFIVTASHGILPEVQRLLLDAFVSVLLILLLTAGMLIIWIYQGIIRPIKNLEEATLNIQQGNLDFTIAADGSDEISELCANFEEMRKRLKESSEQQVVSERGSRELVSNIAHDLLIMCRYFSCFSAWRIRPKSRRNTCALSTARRMKWTRC